MAENEEKTCGNCKKKIKDKNKACYSKTVNEFFCSLDCLTDYAYEYLGCVPLTDEYKYCWESIE